MKSEFATRMSKLRREKGLSQRQAATALGISQALLSHYENDAREPRLDFLSQMCDFYEVTADYLLGRTNERKHEAEILPEKISEVITELEVLKREESDLLNKLREMSKW